MQEENEAKRRRFLRKGIAEASDQGERKSSYMRNGGVWRVAPGATVGSAGSSEGGRGERHGTRGDGSDDDGDGGGRKGWERGIAREEERAGGHSLAAGVGIRSAPTTRVRKILRERILRRRKTSRRWCEGGRQRDSGEDRGRERERERGRGKKKEEEEWRRLPRTYMR